MFPSSRPPRLRSLNLGSARGATAQQAPLTAVKRRKMPSISPDWGLVSHLRVSGKHAPDRRVRIFAVDGRTRVRVRGRACRVAAVARERSSAARQRHRRLVGVPAHRRGEEIRLQEAHRKNAGAHPADARLRHPCEGEHACAHRSGGDDPHLRRHQRGARPGRPVPQGPRDARSLQSGARQQEVQDVRHRCRARQNRRHAANRSPPPKRSRSRAQYGRGGILV